MACLSKAPNKLWKIKPKPNLDNSDIKKANEKGEQNQSQPWTEASGEEDNWNTRRRAEL